MKKLLSVEKMKEYIEINPISVKEGIAETECPSQIADLLLDAEKETQERFGFIWNNEREFCESTEREIELKDE